MCHAQEADIDILEFRIQKPNPNQTRPSYIPPKFTNDCRRQNGVPEMASFFWGGNVMLLKFSSFLILHKNLLAGLLRFLL
ncbi:hypothetical protein CMV_025936 [Castanea mollissima]|uniref:Uncharacterized protein n=1 Tax=Castanea mollissima TaxID=60419 RepID=A0A8J4V841_9ROSI|nr:hypothetical protein CMV_025936 [Castanea mollissima]